MSSPSATTAILKRLRELEAFVEKINRKEGRRSHKAKVLTIASNEIDVGDRDYYLLLPQSGTADDLETINGGQDGYRLTLQTSDTGDTITVKDNVGNILIPTGDKALSLTSHALQLIYNEALSKWIFTGSNL